MPSNMQIHYTLCLPTSTERHELINRGKNHVHIKRGWINLKYKVLVLNVFYFNPNGSNATILKTKQPSRRSWRKSHYQSAK